MTSPHFNIIDTDEPVEVVFKVTKNGKKYDLHMTLEGLRIEGDIVTEKFNMPEFFTDPEACYIWADRLTGIVVREAKVKQREDGRYGIFRDVKD